jgi:hypothetical protein
MSGYSITLFLHSWVRWIILILGLVVLIKAYSGWLGKKPYTKGDNGMSAGWVGFMHLNLLLGLLLYFIFSPYVQQAFNDFGAAMKDASLRFWAVEHIAVNILAVAVAQIGRIKAKKATTDWQKHKITAIWFTISMVLILSRIPWHESARLFRGL